MATRRPPNLSPEDTALWQRVTKKVKPLRSPPEAPAGAATVPEAASSPPPRASRPPAPPAKPPPQLAPIDRRLLRRVGRGAKAVDAVIDLHGLTQDEARRRLLAFLVRSQADGRRLVLVVTGKGRREEMGDWWEEGARGVLRRSVPRWLATEPFRALVVGCERAHTRKGGDGALYVQLRRWRDER